MHWFNRRCRSSTPAPHQPAVQQTHALSKHRGKESQVAHAAPQTLSYLHRQGCGLTNAQLDRKAGARCRQRHGRLALRPPQRQRRKPLLPEHKLSVEQQLDYTD
jgi:hypothetical protein